ncbi:M23 family metallopeptidase [Geojedonia litorea]|uniref:M23 family metallopeptidase n=1 Tax=Geojedonia litorea TaxID=1268269 RepID=A0ABV9N327_9FLAO
MKYHLLILLSSSLCFSQIEYPKDYFRAPLDIELVLAGSFGELRSNHFHSGLDLKTQQRQGLNVYSIAEGYVSRIKISHYGYGKALYITHPNGYTSVYGHLKKFSPKIEAYIKQCQYQKETYEVEVFPTPNELPIFSDEIVALSGNTGSSAGPHLHFEIRDNQERPINPMLFGIDIQDTRPPFVTKVYAFVKDDASFINNKSKRLELRLIPDKNGNYITENIAAYGSIGFGIESNDKQDLAPNNNGLSNIQTFFNGNKSIEIDFKRFSFDESRHINRFVDYEIYKINKIRIQKLFQEKGNPLSLFKEVENEGYVKIEDSTSSIYKIRIQDFKGNEAWVTIPITGKKVNQAPSTNDIKPAYFVYADQPMNFKKDKVSVYIPANTFYDDAYLDINVRSDTLKLHKDVIPLQKNISLFYDVSQYSEVDKSKLFIAELQGFYQRPSYLNTTRKGDSLIARPNSLGTFALARDDKGPSISPINFQHGKWISKLDQLRIKITDDLSGISNYRATINGKWVLMEYEYKDNSLTYYFDDNIIKNAEHNLKLIVTDNVGNSSTFEATFYRK